VGLRGWSDERAKEEGREGRREDKVEVKVGFVFEEGW